MSEYTVHFTTPASFSVTISGSLKPTSTFAPNAAGRQDKELSVDADAAQLLDKHQRNPNGQHDGWWECQCGEPHDGRHLVAVLWARGYTVARTT